MKAFNISFIVIFIIFAALQYNDPDPYVWMPIYLYAAFLCYKAIQKSYSGTLYIIGFIAYAGYALYLFLDKSGVLNWATQHNAENIAETMKATKPWIEETREFFGLVIVMGVLLINTIWLKKSKKTKIASVNRRSL